MPRDSPVNPFETKKLAKQKYAERQIDKFVKWSWEIKGKVKTSEIEHLHERYGIICYTYNRQ
jgi:hypothetical protein